MNWKSVAQISMLALIVFAFITVVIGEPIESQDNSKNEEELKAIELSRIKHQPPIPGSPADRILNLLIQRHLNKEASNGK